MLIEQGGLAADSLKGRVALITGAGGGIGLEAARALAWLGAYVVIAEIDSEKGAAASARINAERGVERSAFHAVDLGDTDAVERLHAEIMARHGRIDVVINNAAIAPIGAVDEIGAAVWDRSYAVNLRAPALLARLCLPDMKRRRSGTLVFVPSSGAAPYMGAYEVFKTAQVELCNTLAAELEGTGILTYAIGPGLVQTDTARQAIVQVARRMGMSEPEFYQLNARHMIDAEAAGTGFALSVVHADRYNGQEIGSIQALLDAGIRLGEPAGPSDPAEPAPAGVCAVADRPALAERMANVQRTYEEQYEGWLARNLFERQWVLRDFRKTVGHSADQFRDSLLAMNPGARITASEALACRDLLSRLRTYYEHQNKLLQGYEKNPDRLRTNTQIIQGWIRDLDAVLDCL